MRVGAPRQAVGQTVGWSSFCQNGTGLARLRFVIPKHGPATVCDLVFVNNAIMQL